MRFLLSLACLAMLGATAHAQVEPMPPADTWLTALAGTWAAPQKPHPAVARIVVPEREGVAFGSGTLVDVNPNSGLVVTNWHVVEAANGPISVQFPDGFRSAAEVLKTDRDWDLAALRIRRPNVQPVRLSPRAPAPGEPLSIAGYGSGSYRAASGRCTQYVAPGANFPYEMVELSAGARQGDSGGPIFNSHGQLAGVLFGESHGKTSGSYCGRVHQFLASLPREAAASAPPAESRLASASTNGQSALAPAAPPPIPRSPGAERPAFDVSPAFISQRSTPTAVPSAVHARPPVDDLGAGWRTSNRFAPPAPTEQASSVPMLALSSWRRVAGESPWDQAKTSLAIFGAMSLLVHGLRLVRRG